MEKEMQLNLIPKISYPYKVIHSYFINYFNSKDYNKIKNAVLGINDYLNEYHKYYLFFEIITSFKDYQNYKMSIPFFNIIFQEDISKSDVMNIINDAVQNKNKLFGIASLFDKISLFSKEEGFFLYMIMQMMINQYYGTLIVLPHDLYNETKNIINKSTLAYYLNGVLINKSEIIKRNLLDDIKNKYSDNIEFFRSLKIKNVYLFGSIKDNEYHRESDIDLVIDFEKNTYKEKVDAFDKIINFNKEHFNRKTDIQEYNDFIEFNPEIKLLKIF